MRKFALKLIKTFLIIYVLLFGLHFMLDYYLSKENSCNNNTWYKIFKGKLDTDIAIIGTSRAQTHYNTEIINKITGLKTYNLGLSGTPYSVLKIRWESYFNRNKKPKILIIDLDASSLQNSKTLFDKFQYLPFFYSKEYQSFAKKNDADFYFEQYIPLYKYRGYEMSIFKQIKSLKNRSICSNVINGYVEHDIDWIEKDYLNFKKILQKDKSRTEYDLKIYNQGLSVLKQIIQDCKKNNIKIYFVWSPSYYESHTYQAPYKKHIDTVLTNIAINENIQYLNFSNDSLCYNRKYFYNSSHMNKRGSTKFSEKIGYLINENK
ncbi:DUF1574 family protein [Zunongwangia sp.]|uniref:DUF1574 family protein n=1 Tax=Zunongwangia sp. TaxID=1965325 RepID=UPI003AA7DD14